MKITLLMSILALSLPPGVPMREPVPGRQAAAHKEEANYFRKMKPRFKYVNLERLSNDKLGRDNNLKLERMDALTYRRLFGKSRILLEP